MPSPDPWREIQEGTLLYCGLIVVDLVHSSDLSGAQIQRFMAKRNLSEMIKTLAASRGAKVFSWAGDGGLIGLQIRDPAKDYDNLVSLAIVLRGLMSAFNDDPVHGNTLGGELRLRVACNAGQLIYSQDPGNIHAGAIDFIMKYEGQLADSPMQVVLTQAVGNELNNERLRSMFVLKKGVEVRKKSGDIDKHDVFVWKPDAVK